MSNLFGDHMKCTRTLSKACQHFLSYRHHIGHKGTRNETCPICLIDIEPEDPTLVDTVCNRAFCEACLTLWLIREVGPDDIDEPDIRRCPNCMRRVRVSELETMWRRMGREALQGPQQQQLPQQAVATTAPEQNTRPSLLAFLIEVFMIICFHYLVWRMLDYLITILEGRLEPVNCFAVVVLLIAMLIPLNYWIITADWLLEGIDGAVRHALARRSDPVRR